MHLGNSESDNHVNIFTSLRKAALNVGCLNKNTISISIHASCLDSEMK